MRAYGLRSFLIDSARALRHVSEHTDLFALVVENGCRHCMHSTCRAGTGRYAIRAE